MKNNDDAISIRTKPVVTSLTRDVGLVEINDTIHSDRQVAAVALIMLNFSPFYPLLPGPR